ncbi:hypothetical protein ACVMAJ_002349 [Bradyrhizobium sp. USDA 4448]
MLEHSQYTGAAGMIAMQTKVEVVKGDIQNQLKARGRSPA